MHLTMFLFQVILSVSPFQDVDDLYFSSQGVIIVHPEQSRKLGHCSCCFPCQISVRKEW